MRKVSFRVSERQVEVWDTLNLKAGVRSVVDKSLQSFNSSNSPLHRTQSRPVSIFKLHSFAMKLISLAAGAIALAMISAEFVDNSVINTTCETGCNSELSFTVRSSGSGGSPQAARDQCSEKCAVSVPERITSCGRICNVPVPVFDDFARAATTSPSVNVCSLCGGDVGAFSQKCREVIDFLEEECEESCRCGTPFEVPGPSFIVSASETGTRTVEGEKQCN